jgi:hypothetical protein
MLKEFVGPLRDKLDDNITAGVDRLKAAITACLTQGLEFIQRTRLTAPGRRLYNIFGDGGSHRNVRRNIPLLDDCRKMTVRLNLNRSWPGAAKARRTAAKRREAVGLGTIRQDISVTDSLLR